LPRDIRAARNAARRAAFVTRCSRPVLIVGMNRKQRERRDYLQWKRELQGPILTVREQKMLELMRKLRTFTYRSDQGCDPTSLALQQLKKAIDEVAAALTGDWEYFWAEHHSIGG
jgi:hypothetical protein